MPTTTDSRTRKDFMARLDALEQRNLTAYWIDWCARCRRWSLNPDWNPSLALWEELERGEQKHRIKD